jgi:DNA-directed RNA polymerase specialized sigma24 family protein
VYSPVADRAIRSSLTQLESQLSDARSLTNEPTHAFQLEDNLYNQRILTDADWTIFKNHFEKVYPGYLFRLRAAFDKLSEAEERLFLFIKLNLKTKESAAILGISVESVKKTRNRLRKRLNLAEEEHLDNFIHNF